MRDKIPGLDGFSMAFFQDCWGVVREEVMKVFFEFQVYMKFEKIFNATFITSIPKKAGVVEMR